MVVVLYIYTLCYKHPIPFWLVRMVDEFIISKTKPMHSITCWCSIVSLFIPLQQNSWNWNFSKQIYRSGKVNIPWNCHLLRWICLGRDKTHFCHRFFAINSTFLVLLCFYFTFVSQKFISLGRVIFSTPLFILFMLQILLSMSEFWICYRKSIIYSFSNKSTAVDSIFKASLSNLPWWICFVIVESCFYGCLSLHF